MSNNNQQQEAMTPLQLYAMTAVETSNRPVDLMTPRHSALDIERWEHPCLEEMEIEGLEVKWLKRHNYDSRRVWELITVWYNGEPCMVVQFAGREGDDHYKRFITNAAVYVSLVQAVRLEIVRQEADSIMEEVTDWINEDQQSIELTDFYHNKLDGHFERFW